jgi:hypothetical protein
MVYDKCNMQDILIFIMLFSVKVQFSRNKGTKQYNYSKLGLR